jgi:SAM-dependent methyltransferase
MSPAWSIEKPDGARKMKSLNLAGGFRHFRYLSMSAVKLAFAGRWASISYNAVMRLRGIDIVKVDLEKLGLNPERCHHYGDSGGPEISKVLKAIAIRKGSKILDIGCGKAEAILTMAKFPFSEIVGVDLSPDLIRIARTNCRKAGVANRVRLIQRDAAEFTELDEFDYLYCFHPFPWIVMEAVCANISASLARKDRPLTLIYKNPVFHNELLGLGIFDFRREFRFPPDDYDYNLFRIYGHEDAADSP